ncbi:MAG: gamma-glutamyl-gamma-aminobutyrate hydrolase family protein [Deltaproteobacteria bacterium]|nr:gamma-glutamyl-gamma-aminobutyrate hydrolase family protein [Deltaproteobacteria bacterium]
MIKIGVTACFLYPDPNRPVFGPKTLSYLENEMADYLAHQGAMPVLIPDLGEKKLKEFLAEIDGFVFPGGSDLAPESYREKPIQNGKWLGDPYRDAYELKILDAAIRQGKPVLGICRGCQLINVYFGGTLYQDISSQKEGTLVHRDAGEYDKVNHTIQFQSGGFLEKIYGRATPKMVNSVHHQGVKDLGKGLVVEAISPEDQLIEAVSYKDPKKFVVGVQWHPEFSETLKGKVLPPEPLYEAFLEVVKKEKAG